MFLDDIKKIKSEKKDLRSFGYTVGIVFGLIAALGWWKQKDWASVLTFISVFLIFFGAAAPHLLKPLNKAWMTLALCLGWVMTRVILCILFYLVLTPLSVTGSIHVQFRTLGVTLAARRGATRNRMRRFFTAWLGLNLVSRLAIQCLVR